MHRARRNIFLGLISLFLITFLLEGCLAQKNKIAPLDSARNPLSVSQETEMKEQAELETAGRIREMLTAGGGNTVSLETLRPGEAGQNYDLNVVKEDVAKKTAIELKSESPERPKITDDIIIFNDLKQIDLDNDGKKDIIALYANNQDSKGVKVIKIKNGQSAVIFNRIFGPKQIKLEVQNHTPVIIIKEGYSIFSHPKEIYRWNGKTFILEKAL